MHASRTRSALMGFGAGLLLACSVQSAAALQSATASMSHPALAADTQSVAATDIHSATETLSPTASETPSHSMWMTTLGGGHLMAMAHAFPSATAAAPLSSDSPLSRNRVALPHVALMANLESHDARWVFRFMPNFEGLTLPNGEVAFGGWGEGFIDARHPHTLLHEAMLSLNVWEAPGGQFSISAGRGFAPFGTEDPMYRPALKYPTNHHLSQILERWTLNAVYLTSAGLGIEVGLFDGDEPEDWLDVGNVRNFGNSWSTRWSVRVGELAGITADWEASASYGRVREHHGVDHGGTHGHSEEAGHAELTELFNVALRHEATYSAGHLYGLLEWSRSRPEEGDGYESILGELQMALGAEARHRPFLRLEASTRPEYAREASRGDDFFRYDHGTPALGATRWLISTAGYSLNLTELPLSARPFVELQHHRISAERGPESVGPDALFGGSGFWSVTTGVRVFLGGGPMRMGSYGVLDPMTASMRQMRSDHMDMNHAPAHVDHHDHP